MKPGDRTYNLGRLEELKSKKRELQVRADGLAKNISFHFDPQDMALDYTLRIDPGSRRNDRPPTIPGRDGELPHDDPRTPDRGL
jgi:hypothetical protein